MREVFYSLEQISCPVSSSSIDRNSRGGGKCSGRTGKREHRRRPRVRYVAAAGEDFLTWRHIPPAADVIEVGSPAAGEQKANIY